MRSPHGALAPACAVSVQDAVQGIGGVIWLWAALA